MADQLNKPVVKFRGFEDEWVVSQLDEVADLITGHPFESKKFVEHGVFLVRGMNVKRGHLDMSESVSEFWPSSNGLEGYLLQEGDILIQMDGALIGKSYARVERKHLPALLVQRVTRIRADEGDSEVIYQYIQKDFLNHIGSIKTETAVPHLSLNDIRSFPIAMPSKDEKSQIGTFFQNLDKLLTFHQQKCDKLIKLKKAMLEKMFPKKGTDVPEVRFKGFTGAWRQCDLSSAIDLRSGCDYKHLAKGRIPVYGTGGYMLSVNEALSYKKDAIGIGRKGTIDKPFILKAPFWTVDTLFYALPKANNDLHFINCIFQKINWKQKDESTGVPSLSKVAINSIQIRSTDIIEQQKIGTYFQNIDNLIAHHQTQHVKLKNIKKACLEKMFV